MGIDMLDIGFRVEKNFGLKKFRPLPPVGPPLWTAGDLFELIWRGLQGEESAWEWAPVWELMPHAWELRRQSSSYLRGFHPGWTIFMPDQLDRLIPVADRPGVWNRLLTLWEVNVPRHVPPASDGGFEFPIGCQTTHRLIDLFERAWWESRFQRQDQWRPSTHPPPPDAHKWTREAAWLTFVEILCESLRVDVDEVTPNATLVGDLGME